MGDTGARAWQQVLPAGGCWWARGAGVGRGAGGGTDSSSEATGRLRKVRKHRAGSRRLSGSLRTPGQRGSLPLPHEGPPGGLGCPASR